MKKVLSTTLLLGTILLLSLVTAAATPVTVSSLQFGKLQDKPPWAGGPGGPNGGDGDGDGDTATYALYIEIDYMAGHEPTQGVLDYIVNYYDARGISVTFYVDDINGYSDLVVDPTPSTGVTDEDFWAIEATYNDNDYEYFDEWKWALFGTTVEGESDVMGYCWVATSRKDVLAGNYIFIADQTADDWAQNVGIDAYGAEAAVLMHEMGHSIGIGKLHPVFGEKYDPDLSSVMSYLSEANAGLYGDWYYSDEYWATRNMEYYEEEIVA